MTERPPSIATQNATPAQTASNITASANDALPVIESADEEPYTIKCICDYSDDDGNTIYCETCDTWQHIECFYPGRVDDASREEFDHSCADCKPRPLDRRHATERQRHQRQNKSVSDSGEKKTKRPPSKSHKKKAKPIEVQTNGFHDHDGHRNGSPHEQHTHSKKAKGHRSAQSISAQSKRSPPLNVRHQHHIHPPSPAHTPPDLPSDFQVHGYSDTFLNLYDKDRFQESSTNSFASLEVSNSMTLWLRNPERLQKDAGISTEDAFQYLKVGVESLKWPDLRVEPRDAVIHDTMLTWRSLITPTHLVQPGRIGELNGLVGFQKDYCCDVDNRWQDSAHPRPFVFFHPRLPLFIDTRQEGSVCRYVRRSCRANTNLETFIAGGTEYHFWLTSERPLVANEQITIPWDFKFPLQYNSRFLHLLNLGDEDGIPVDCADITDEEYIQLTQIIHLVLSDHGGCACDLGNDCAFARFHRNYQHRSHNPTSGAKSKKGRKSKPNHVSPTSTGHATNSRAASEGQQEQYDEDDNRSVSGSVRSKPHSRDLTPSHGIGEPNGILTEPSDREKRKLAMLEDSFRKMEQGQPPRKKKRASDGSNMSVPNQLSTSQAAPKPRQKSVAPRMSISQPSMSNVGGSRARHYVDANTSRRQSGSPFSAVSPTAILPSPRNPELRTGSIPGRSRQTSLTLKTIYQDLSTQTDDVEDAWWKGPRPKRNRSIIPMANRLVNNRHRLQAQQDIENNQTHPLSNGIGDESWEVSPTDSMDLDIPMQDDQFHPESPTNSHPRKASISSWSPSVDAQSSTVDYSMPEAPPVTTSSAIKPPPPPWPGQLNSLNGGPESHITAKMPDLRVQLPPAPIFSNPNLTGTPSGSVTPSSAAGSLAQSPFGSVHLAVAFPPPAINGIGQTASPIKTTKKLSLSDYKARLKKSDSSTINRQSSGKSPTLGHAVLKPSLSTVDEVRAPGILEGSAMVDSPVVEPEGVHPALVANLEPSPTNHRPLDRVSGTL